MSMDGYSVIRYNCRIADIIPKSILKIEMKVNSSLGKNAAACVIKLERH